MKTPLASSGGTGGSGDSTVTSYKIDNQDEQRIEKLTSCSRTNIGSNIFDAASRCQISANTILRSAWAIVLHRHFTNDHFDLTVLQEEQNIDLKSFGSRVALSYIPISLEVESETSLYDFLFTVEAAERLESKTTELTDGGIQCILADYSCDVSASTLQNQVCGQRILVSHEFNSSGKLRTDCYYTPNNTASFCEALVNHLATLLENMVEILLRYQPETSCERYASSTRTMSRTIADLSMVSESEEKQLREVARPPRIRDDWFVGSFHQIFRKQARLSPEAPALENEEHEKMSYGELDHASDSMADELSRRVSGNSHRHFTEGGHGVEGTQTVALLIERSFDLYIAAFAAWKAGLAILLLDPSVPKSRNEYMIKDADCALVLTNTPSTDFPESWTYDFDRIRSLASSEFRGNSASKGAAAADINKIDKMENFHRLFLVAYTSGSTGKPKGVGHSPCTWGRVWSQLSTRANHRCLILINPLAGAASLPMWHILMSGGCLVILPKTLMDDLVWCVNEFQIDDMCLPPSALSLLSPEEVPTLKYMMLAGEIIQSESLNPWKGKASLVGHYGMTESGTATSCPSLTARDDGVIQYTQHGADTSFYVCQPGSDRLSGFYVPGEICIGSTYHSPGYISLPEKTRLVFSQNPFSTDYGHLRFVRSGDVGMIVEEGAMRMVGRADEQIKIDGNRVDPRDVEVTIGSLSSVKEVKVLQPRGTQSLVACIVPHSDSLSSADSKAAFATEARQICGRKLPAYMVPGRFCFLKCIARTPTSKVDFARLREDVNEALRDQEQNQNRDHELNRPLTNAELAIVDACQPELSEVTGISSDQWLSRSFVELGGTSLNAMKALNRLRRSGWKMSLESLLGSSNLEAAARALERIESGKELARPKITPKYQLPGDFGLDRKNIEAIYPATPFQSEAILVSLQFPRQHTLYRFFDLSVFPSLTESVLRQSLQLLMDAKPTLRTVIVPASQDIADWQTHQYTGADMSSQSFLNIIQKAATFEFTDGGNAQSPEEFYTHDSQRCWKLGEPLWKATYLKESNLLALNLSHILFDAWCEDFVNEDLFGVISEIIKSPSSEKDISQARSIAQRPSMESWSRNMYGAKGLATNVNENPMKPYTEKWAKYLEGCKPTHLDDTDLKPPFKEGERQTVIEHPLSIDFKPFCQAHNLTVGAVYSAAGALTLARLFSEAPSEITFYRIGGNRETTEKAAEIEGALLSISPLRVPIQSDRSLLDMTKDVMQNYLSMRPAEPFYIDEMTPGGPQDRSGQGMVRKYGNVLFNYVLDFEDSSQSPRRPRFTDVREEYTRFGEKIAYFMLEIDLMEIVSSQGSKFMLSSGSEFPAERETRILRILETMLNEIVSKGSELKVDDILKIEVE